MLGPPAYPQHKIHATVANINRPPVHSIFAWMDLPIPKHATEQKFEPHNNLQILYLTYVTHPKLLELKPAYRQHIRNSTWDILCTGSLPYVSSRPGFYKWCSAGPPSSARRAFRQTLTIHLPQLVKTFPAFYAT